MGLIHSNEAFHHRVRRKAFQSNIQLFWKTTCAFWNEVTFALACSSQCFKAAYFSVSGSLDSRRFMWLLLWAMKTLWLSWQIMERLLTRWMWWVQPSPTPPEPNKPFQKFPFNNEKNKVKWIILAKPHRPAVFLTGTCHCMPHWFGLPFHKAF